MTPPDTKRTRGEPDHRYLVPGLSRGIAMLRLFSPERPRLSVADLAAGAGVTRSTAYRLIYTLETEGLIAREPDGRSYALTAEVLRLGFDVLSTRTAREAAEPFLAALSGRTSLSAYLAVLEGTDVLYVAHSPATASLVSSLQVGARQAAWSTSSGRILLAHLDAADLGRFAGDNNDGGPDAATLAERAGEDRARGVVHRRSEHDVHMASCAAPVRGAGGRVVAAMTAIGPASRVLDPGEADRIRAEVVRAARDLSSALGATGG